MEDRATRRFFDAARKLGPMVAGALLKRGVIARAMPQGVRPTPVLVSVRG